MKVLVAGIGNIFLGDDAFGVEVVKHIDPSLMPDGVKVTDFGIRGVHLSYELLDGYDALVLIDAMPLGEPPGTVAIFEPDVESIDPTSVDAHSMSPAVVLGLLAGLGGHVPRVLVVACEPLTVEEGLGLSEPVASAVAPAIETVHRLVARICSDITLADIHPADIHSGAAKELQS
jgi:hydrogenase maturation protease